MKPSSRNYQNTMKNRSKISFLLSRMLVAKKWKSMQKKLKEWKKMIAKWLKDAAPTDQIKKNIMLPFPLSLPALSYQSILETLQILKMDRITPLSNKMEVQFRHWYLNFSANSNSSNNMLCNFSILLISIPTISSIAEIKRYFITFLVTITIRLLSNKIMKLKSKMQVTSITPIIMNNKNKYKEMLKIDNNKATCTICPQSITTTTNQKKRKGIILPFLLLKFLK